MRVLLNVLAVLCVAALAAAAPKKKKETSIVRDGGKTFYGSYGEVLPGTYPADYCWEFEGPCEQPCGYTYAGFDAYDLEDGTQEVRAFGLCASDF
jgi:hypothetical protein